MNTYELTFVVSDEITEDNLGGIISEIAKEIESLGGVIVKEEPWGKRRLAYPIKRRSNGYYVTVETHLEASKIKELDRYLRLYTMVLRHLIIISPPQSLKTTDDSELSDSLEKRVEEKTAKKVEDKVTEVTKAEEPVAPTSEAVESEIEEEKPKTKKKRVSKSNEEEKKEENAEERRKLVEKKLNEILKS
jgi:small subunit ribosomal protein S6